MMQKKLCFLSFLDSLYTLLNDCFYLAKNGNKRLWKVDTYEREDWNNSLSYREIFFSFDDFVSCACLVKISSDITKLVGMIALNFVKSSSNTKCTETNRVRLNMRKSNLYINSLALTHRWDISYGLRTHTIYSEVSWFYKTMRLDYLNSGSVLVNT